MWYVEGWECAKSIFGSMWVAEKALCARWRKMGMGSGMGEMGLLALSGAECEGGRETGSQGKRLDA